MCDSLPIRGNAWQEPGGGQAKDELLDCLLELTNDVVESLRTAASEKDRIETNIRHIADKTQYTKPNIRQAISSNARTSLEVTDAVVVTCEVLREMITARLTEPVTSTQKGQAHMVAISESLKSILQEDIYHEAAREAVAKLTGKSSGQPKFGGGNLSVPGGRPANNLNQPGPPSADPRATMQVDDMSPRTMGEYQHTYLEGSGRPVSYMPDDVRNDGGRDDFYANDNWARETSTVPSGLRDWMHQQEEKNLRASRKPTSAGRYVGQVLESVFPEDGPAKPSTTIGYIP